MTFTTNTVTGGTNGTVSSFRRASFGFGDGEVGVNANHNTFSGAGRHVDVEETGTALASVAANRNSLTKLVNSGATTVDARCNWWGSSSGPATGQYFGPATVAPFLATSNLSGACKPIASLAARPRRAPDGRGQQQLPHRER